MRSICKSILVLFCALILAALAPEDTYAANEIQVTATAVSGNEIELEWNIAAGSSGYQILRSREQAGNYAEIATVDGAKKSTYIDNSVVPGKNYYYKVRSVKKGQSGKSFTSKPVAARTIGETTINSIVSVSSDSMQITWKKVNKAKSYEIYRSTRERNGYKKIGIVRSNIREYTDKTVKSGKKYYYRIVVTGSFNGEEIKSGYSETVSYRTLKQVKISSVKPTEGDGLNIKWEKVSGATKYRVYRSETQSGTYKKIATVPSSGDSKLVYTDNTVISGRTYYYKVQAYSDGKGMILAGGGSKSQARSGSTAYSIMGETSVTVDQMMRVFNASGRKYPASIYKEKGAKNLKKFCEIIIDECEREGVRAEVIFAQICVETGYLKFGGQVSASQCNFAGLGATDDGAAGVNFPNVKIGIRAQVQHLKGYASEESLNQKCVDPRFSYLTLKRGSAQYVQNLGNGNWATDPTYASKLMTLIRAMQKY